MGFTISWVVSTRKAAHSSVTNFTGGKVASHLTRVDNGRVRNWSEQRTVLEAMADTAEIVDRGFTFVDEKGKESFIPFPDLVSEARRYATGLQALGLSRGDRVALIIPDHQPFIVTFLGAITAGLIPVPIYPPLSLAKLDNWFETTTRILRVAGAEAIITVDDVRTLL